MQIYKQQSEIVITNHLITELRKIRFSNYENKFAKSIFFCALSIGTHFAILDK